MTRAFLALPIDEVAIDALAELQGHIPFGRPVPEDNLHLTLAFLGNVEDAVLEKIHATLERTALPAPTIVFNRLGTFAEMERGLVFAEVASDEILVALQSKLARIAREAGAELPRRRFRPHVTLMRANRQPRGPARDRLAAIIGAPISVPDFRAGQLCLYRSDLTPNGARHDVMADYPLIG